MSDCDDMPSFTTTRITASASAEPSQVPSAVALESVAAAESAATDSVQLRLVHFLHKDITDNAAVYEKVVNSCKLSQDAPEGWLPVLWVKERLAKLHPELLLQMPHYNVTIAAALEAVLESSGIRKRSDIGTAMKKQVAAQLSCAITSSFTAVVVKLYDARIQLRDLSSYQPPARTASFNRKKRDRNDGEVTSPARRATTVSDREIAKLKRELQDMTARQEALQVVSDGLRKDKLQQQMVHQIALNELYAKIEELQDNLIVATTRQIEYDERAPAQQRNLAFITAARNEAQHLAEKRKECIAGLEQVVLTQQKERLKEVAALQQAIEVKNKKLSKLNKKVNALEGSSGRSNLKKKSRDSEPAAAAEEVKTDSFQGTFPSESNEPSGSASCLEVLEARLLEWQAERFALLQRIQDAAGFEERAKEEDMVCTVCMRSVTRARLECGHGFCNSCLEEVPSCPLCRAAKKVKVSL